MLELQSTVEWAMPLRMAVYVGLTLQAEVRQGRVRPGQLPPVEAVVLYTGREPWDWSLRLSDLYMPCPEDVAARQLGIECTLVQACHEQDLDLEPLNLSDAVFRLLRGSRAEVADVASRLQRRLAGPEHSSLRKAITRLMQEVVLPTRAPELEESEWARLTNLEDLTAMLDNNAITFKEAERAKLLAQGKAEGQAEGQKGLLVTLAGRKWGVKVAADLEGILAPIASAEALEQVGSSILLAATAEQFLSGVRKI